MKCAEISVAMVSVQIERMEGVALFLPKKIAKSEQTDGNEDDVGKLLITSHADGAKLALRSVRVLIG